MKIDRRMLLWAGLVLLLIYELWALHVGDGSTISEIVWRASTRPILPFTFGVLMGHFFWQRKS